MQILTEKKTLEVKKKDKHMTPPCFMVRKHFL